MATRATLGSEKFGNLLQSLKGSTTFVLQHCDGLADAIERNNAIKIEALCAQYTRAMGKFGLKFGEMDVLVLGCTHYPFIAEQLSATVGENIMQLECGAPVARQTRRLLSERQILTIEQTHSDAETGQLKLFSTGDPNALETAALRWLNENVGVRAVIIHQGCESKDSNC